MSGRFVLRYRRGWQLWCRPGRGLGGEPPRVLCDVGPEHPVPGGRTPVEARARREPPHGFLRRGDGGPQPGDGPPYLM